jgi:uncharacterized membrane protein
MLTALAPICGLAIGMLFATLAAEAITKRANTHWRYSIRTLFYAVALVSLAMFTLVVRQRSDSTAPQYANSAVQAPTHFRAR